MKNVFLLLLLITSQQLLAQNITFLSPDENGNIRYQQIEQVDSINSDKIFSSARNWMAERFVDADKVIDSEDRSSGTIIGRFISTYGGSLMGVEYDVTIKIEIKDGRFRVTFLNIKNHQYGSSAEWVLFNKKGEPRSTYKGTIGDMNNSFHSMVDDLKNYIVNANNTSDDW